MNEAFAEYRLPDLRPIPWDEFRSEFLSLYRQPMKARKTLLHTTHALGLLTQLGMQSTADLTPALIAALVTSHSPGRSANTVRSRLRAIQAACTYAEKCGYVRISPFRIRGISTWIRPAPPKGKKHHSRAEIKAVLALMAKQAAEFTGWAQWRARRLYALASTLCYTGVRAGEGYHLQIPDIDLERGVCFVRPHEGYRLKTAASEAVIPLAPALIPILKDWLAHRLDAPPGFCVDQSCPWVFPNTHRASPWRSGSPGQTPRDRMVAVGAAAGVFGFTPLSCRHSLATHLKTAFHQSEAFTKRVLRHTNLSTQAYYTHDDLDNLREGIARVEY